MEQKVTQNKPTLILQYGTYDSKALKGESHKDVPVMVTEFNETMRDLIEGLCKNPDIPESLRPTYRISEDPAEPYSTRSYSLPMLQVNLPAVDPRLASDLTFVPKSDRGSTNGSTPEVQSSREVSWKFEMFREEKTCAKKPKAASDSDDTELTTTTSQEVPSGQGFGLNITNTFKSHQLPERGLTRDKLVPTVGKYLDQLIRYGSFPLDKTATEIFDTGILKDQDFELLAKRAAEGLSKGLVARYEILDKFFKQKQTVNELAKEYPYYSIMQLLKLITDAAKGVDSLDLEDHVWNNAIDTQVLLDLSGKDLEAFTATVKEIRNEHPELLENIEFTVMRNRPRTRDNPAESDVAAYASSFFEKATPKRSNLLVIGNPYTDYTSLINTMSFNRKGSKVSLLGLLRAWGNSNQDKFWEQQESRISLHPLVNVVDVLFSKNFDAITTLSVKEGNKVKEICDVDPQKLVLATRGSLSDINLTDPITLKERIISVLESRFNESRILNRDISDLIPQDGNKVTSKTALDLIIKENGSTCNISTIRAYGDLETAMRGLIKACTKTEADQARKVKIEEFIEEITAAKQKLKSELELNQSSLDSRMNNIQLLEKVPQPIYVIEGKGKTPTIKPLPDKLLRQLETAKKLPPKYMPRALDGLNQGLLDAILTPNVSADLHLDHDTAALLRGEEYGEYESNGHNLNLIIALRLLMALKNDNDPVWRGCKEFHRPIPPTERINTVARSLQQLGMIIYDKYNLNSKAKCSETRSDNTVTANDEG